MTIKIYAVVYSNYWPREVDSLWTKEEDAQKLAESLEGEWNVETMTVFENPIEIQPGWEAR